MTNSVILKQSDEKGVTQFHVLGLNDNDFFDSLLSFLQQSYSAILINEDDGIYTKKAYLSIRGLPVTLEHSDDIGNFFYSNEKDASALLDEISADLDSRLKDIHYE